ncbi:peptide deformylase [Cereibacter ovatus]|uniref:Peptide deformylase n=1 Tax=Cereibacter ovatus TaxID=439529 RepID=A0A285D0Q7_9RHOB|nr:peptide deformylase [Cereibacter ovatus]SNX72878.1 peptide deformylase [Cereibacter ovatus]
MSALPVLRWPDPRLTQRCGAATLGPDLDRLAADMLAVMYHERGRGLAAPQVGAMLRLFVMDVAWKEGPAEPQVFVNPEILWMSDDRTEGPEGCLSIPGVVAHVSRAASIRLRWTSLFGAEQEAGFSGLAAICAQHEIDHLDGVVTLDRLSPAARAAALAEYAA